MNAIMLKQYRDMKTKHPDALLLFRNDGNHPATYDLFGEDAITAGVILSLDPDLSGESVFLSLHHDLLDKFLPMLTRTGKRVAICEQLKDPRTSRPLVKCSSGILEK